MDELRTVPGKQEPESQIMLVSLLAYPHFHPQGGDRVEGVAALVL